MEDVPIRILGRTRNEIGDHFEYLTKLMLGRLGFGSFVRDAYMTGAEIDLRASHQVTNAPILCECKAHSKPVGTRDVRSFYSEIEKQRRANPRLFGLFLSTSGFAGTAEAWYDEFTAQDPKVAEYFQLKSARGVLDMLIDAGMALEPEAIRKAVSQRLPTYKQGSCWLTYSAHGLAWLILLLVDGRPRFHTILGPCGDPLPTWVCREVAWLMRKELKDTGLLGLEVRYKVLVSLLKQEDQIIQIIAEQVKESPDDVTLALEKLETEGVVCGEGDGDRHFRFARDLVPFINLAREFLEDDNALTFIQSPYGQEMLYSETLLSYIDQRYCLGMDANQKNTLGRILSISPRAAREALFNDPQLYQRVHQEILEKIQDEQERSRWESEHAWSLIQDLLPVLIGDLQEHKISSHMTNLGINRYRLRTRLDMTGSAGTYLSVDATRLFAIEKAGESIKAGSLVT